jgi:hypothetical protein
MLAGMLLGTWLFEKAIDTRRFISQMPRWSRSKVTNTAA